MVKPFDNMRIDQDFGNPTNPYYGPHEGWDLNRQGTSGNQDLGTPLRAAGDGEVAHSSESTKDYGKLVVLYLKGSFGERWARYCHCEQILVKSGLVKAGDIVSTMGSTGNSTASHLHFDVFKKKPPTWRWFAKTKELHAEYFEDPKLFFDLPTSTIDQMPNWLVGMYNERGIDITQPEPVVRPKVQEVFDEAKNYDEVNKRYKDLQEDYTVASGELEKKKQELQLSDEGRSRLETELEEEKRKIVNRDVEVSNLKEQIEKLESGLAPQIPSVNVLTRVLKWLLRKR